MSLFNKALAANSRAGKGLPEGFELYATKGFYPLLLALEEADKNGFLPEGVKEQWEAFEYAEVKHTPGGLS